MGLTQQDALQLGKMYKCESQVKRFKVCPNDGTQCSSEACGCHQDATQKSEVMKTEKKKGCFQCLKRCPDEPSGITSICGCPAGLKKSSFEQSGKTYHQCKSLKQKRCPDAPSGITGDCGCPAGLIKSSFEQSGKTYHQCKQLKQCPSCQSSFTNDKDCFCSKGAKTNNNGWYCCDLSVPAPRPAPPPPRPAPPPPPPATQPPVTKPPVTQPPATQPPATQPPATQPPATQPPATQPPATQPPATQPPATQPPATQPPTPAPTPLTYFRFRNKKDWSKNCLDLDVHSKNIIVWECHDGDNQKWAWDGGRLRSKENSNLCVTMGGRNGESVKASECGGSADQAIKQGKDETMKTSTECTVDGEVKRCCLDWDWDDPHEVLAWGCHGRVNQKWVQAK